MDDLATQFDAAVAASKSLPDKPGNAVLLQLYAVYKQATHGDVTGERPGFSDFVGRAKWDAWHELAGTAPDDAKQRYIALVNSLR